MDYRLTFEELDRINAARTEMAERGELVCERTGCGEPATAVTLADKAPRFLCDRHGEEEADELARRDLDDIKLRGA